MTPETKVCSACGEAKALTEFAKWKAECRACRSARNKLFREANKEVLAERQKARAALKREAKAKLKAENAPALAEARQAHRMRYLANPDVQERNRARNAAWYLQNKAEAKARKAAWYLQNKAEVNSRCREYKRVGRAELSDTYVRDQMRRRNYPDELMIPDVVALTRVRIEINREIRCRT